MKDILGFFISFLPPFFLLVYPTVFILMRKRHAYSPISKLLWFFFWLSFVLFVLSFSSAIIYASMYGVFEFAGLVFLIIYFGSFLLGPCTLMLLGIVSAVRYHLKLPSERVASEQTSRLFKQGAVTIAVFALVYYPLAGLYHEIREYRASVAAEERKTKRAAEKAESAKERAALRAHAAKEAVESNTATTTHAAVDLPADKRTFKRDDLGISFSYPTEFGDIDFTIRPGDTGQAFLGTFTKVDIAFAGNSPGFSEGRGGSFLDSTLGNSPVSSWKESDEYVDTFSVQGTSIVYVRGKLEPGMDTFIDGQIGALLRLSSETFPNMAIRATLSEQVTEEKFKNMLKSIVIE